MEIGKILRKLCDFKQVTIVEAEVCPDHVHMLVEIPPKMSVSGFVGYLKGKSSLIIYQRWGNLKFKYRNREFWCRGYYVDTVGKNKAKIAEYIRNQLKEDEAVVQLTIDFDEDPFTGSGYLFYLTRNFASNIDLINVILAVFFFSRFDNIIYFLFRD